MAEKPFEAMKSQARQLDVGIDKLVKMWKMPDVFFGPYAECSEETTEIIETVWQSVRSTQGDIKETLTIVKQDILNMEQTLSNTKEAYSEIKNISNELTNVMAQYGYQYDQIDDTDRVSSGEEDEPPVPQCLEVEFTPDLSCKSVTKAEMLTPATHYNRLPRAIATPVMISLASATRAVLSAPSIANMKPIRRTNLLKALE